MVASKGQLGEVDVTELAEVLRNTRVSERFPSILDRPAWAAVAARLGQTATAALIEQAVADAARPPSPLPATLWLDFARTGQRHAYEEPASLRRRMLWNLTVAECLEDRGRFLDPILDLIWAICEESSWAYPAHVDALPNVTRPYLDLGAAGVALMLAEADALLGPKLDGQLTRRIRTEIEWRCFGPYLTRDDHWWLFQSKGRNAANWTAVCNSGIVGAAIYLENDPARLATMLARAVRSLQDYLDSFDPDGGSSEGPGYWGYGFGNYVLLADLVAWRTGGKLDLLASERLHKIATFPLRTLLSRGTYVNFSDCDPDVALEPALLHYLGHRLHLPELHGLAIVQPDHAPHRAYFDWGLRHLFWLPPAAPPTTYAPAHHDWFSGLQWMFARYDPTDADALVLAAKGGHNDEMHNQNDVGNLIVHWRGESFLADLGRGHYTKEYFGEQRYDYLVNSSLGHSVPVVNGQPQGTGAAFAARVLAHETDARQTMLLLDLTHVYPAAAGLESLQRRVTLHRDAPHGWVALQDQYRFAAGAAPFESVLITLATVTIGEDEVLIHGERGKVRVGFDPTLVNAQVEARAVAYDHGTETVQRVLFTMHAPVQWGKIDLEIRCQA